MVVDGSGRLTQTGGIDKDMDVNVGRYAFVVELGEYFDSGPARIMGDYPEAVWSPDEE